MLYLVLKLILGAVAFYAARRAMSDQDGGRDEDHSCALS